MPVSESLPPADSTRSGADSSRHLLDSLPALPRLALSYAPGAARAPTLALLALDARLAGIVRGASEPMLAQLRLAWWRDLLAGQASAWPSGEPLLSALRTWRGRHGALGPLVDGWEAMTLPPPLGEQALLALVDARAQSFVALADLLGSGDAPGDIAAIARRWALADLADRVSDPDERTPLEDLLAKTCPPSCRLSRAMRPLVVLEGLARRRRSGLTAMITAIRLGLLGR